MTNKLNQSEENYKFTFIKMLIVTIILLIFVIIFALSIKNITSLLLGAVISFINVYWLQKIIISMAKEGRITKKTGISMGLKVLFIFGSITIIILKTKINILIFLLGLSILPVVVFLDSFKMILKIFGGMSNGGSRT